MTGQWTLYFIPLFIGAILMFSLAAITLKHRQARGALPLAGVLIGAGLFNLFYIPQLWTTDPMGSLFWSQMQLPAWTSAAVFAFILSLEYTNREHWLNKVRIGALFAVPAVATVLYFLQPDLFQANVRMRTELSLVVMETDRQLGWWLIISYGYGLVFAAVALLSHQFSRSIGVGHFRGQSLTLIVGLLAPVGAHALQTILGFEVAFASFGFVVMGVLAYLTVFRFNLLNSVPVARRKVLAEMTDGFLVVDSENQIIDANQPARELFDGQSLIGKDIEDVFPEYETVPRTSQDGQVRHEYRHSKGVTDRVFDVRISPVAGLRGRVDAHIVRFHDITDRHRQEQQLRRQNERLDQFASMVAHDLRNPHSVAMGRAQSMAEEGDSEHAESLLNSLTRMDTIMADTLDLARAGKDIDRTDDVPLAACVKEAWRNVETQDASLTVRIGEEMIKADGNRLTQVFENLFRNAIEHGGANVAIEVGNIADKRGFYIEDNGAGIPEQDREHVLEPGFTTNEDGTGLGLAIVAEIVRAHDWDILITEGSEGGARFEIREVESID